MTVDEFAHVGAGVSHWQRFDLRFNVEHPPLAKLIAALPIVIRGTRTDYSSPAWQVSSDFFYACGAQYAFGNDVFSHWNDWRSTITLARFPMLLLTVALGWIVYRYASRIGGFSGGLLCSSG